MNRMTLFDPRCSGMFISICTQFVHQPFFFKQQNSQTAASAGVRGRYLDI